MKHAFLIDASNEVSPDYVNTAIETCKEFLELFPEYKDKFDIKIRYSGKEVSAITGKSVDFDGTISKEQFEQDHPNGNDEFIALPNGRYLVPGESMAWYEAHAKRQDGDLNFSKARLKQLEWAVGSAQRISTRYFHLGITNKKLYNNDGLFGYGISSPEIGTFVSTSNFDKERFKRLIMHEFGHVFKAVHTERSNITDTQYGEHCATEGCIVRDVVYQSLEEANKPKLFCDQCIEAMRTYIGKIVENERTTEGHTNVVDSSQELPPNSEPNDEFKKPWRDFAQNLAQKMNWEYEEDEKETNFKAKLKANDGSSTLVCASSKNDVSLSAKDKDGNPKVPDMAVFKELVAKAKNENKGIKFGDIKTPEFKARLLAAAMASNPPVKTVGAPELNDEFLNSIDPKTAQLLRTLKNKQQFRDNNNEAKEESSKEDTSEESNTKENTSEDNSAKEEKPSVYEETMAERKRFLEAKANTNSLTPMEQAELNYISQKQAREQAFDEAKARTGKEDPRTAEHTQNTGLEAKNYEYFPASRRECNGWKLHLDVVPNRDDETTRDVSDFLAKLGVNHKVAKGGENGKGMTIYVGSYDDTLKLAKEIKSRFGKDVAEPPIYTDQKSQEIDFNNIVTGRFYLQKLFATQYPRSSIKGVCLADYGSTIDYSIAALAIDAAKNNGLISQDYSSYGVKKQSNFHDYYVVSNMESYCSHKIYQKYLGEYYCGNDAEKFEKEIFGDALPPKGSEERKIWDDVAVRYAKVLEANAPYKIKLMQSVKQGYTPIDFRKAPMRFNSHQRTGRTNP